MHKLFLKEQELSNVYYYYNHNNLLFKRKKNLILTLTQPKPASNLAVLFPL